MEEFGNDLMNLFVRYHNLLLRYHHQSHHGRGVDTMRGQGRVLSILKMKPEITQKELAYLLDMRVQSLSELLAKLEGKGHITRTPSQQDRRVMVVRLTEAGEAAVQDFAAPDVEGPFQCLSLEEQEVLVGYMKRLIAAIEELGASEETVRGFGDFRGTWEGPHGRHGHTPPPPPPHHHHHGRGDRFDPRDREAMWREMMGGTPANGGDEED